MFGKKSSEKSAKKVFLYSHEYRDQKMGEQNARNNFSRKQLIVRAKNVGEKIVGKKGEKRFLYSKKIVTKYGGKKRAKQFFRNTRIVRPKMLGKKSSEKSAKNVFLYSHKYRDQKMGGTKRAKQFFQKHTNSAS